MFPLHTLHTLYDPYMPNSNPIFIPRKHTVCTYRQQARNAKKSRNLKAKNPK